MAIIAVALIIASSTIAFLTTTVEAGNSGISYTVKKIPDSTSVDSKGKVQIITGKTIVMSGNGRTAYSTVDSSRAIQWAIDHASPGKAVLILAERYTLSTNLVLKSGMTLIGEGDRTILENGGLGVYSSNVVIKSLRLEGTCHISIASNKGKISNILIENVSASVGVTQAVFSVTANTYEVSNVKFIKDTVTDSSAYGFRLLGNALISEVLFNSCKAIRLGLNDRPDDGVVGFDLVNTNVRNITVLRSEASNNWENGFRAYTANSDIPVSKTNVILQDCTANANGQKPGSSEGYGYLDRP